MDKKSIGGRAHCLVLPYPAQGHINPMLQFSKLLEHHGVTITLVSTRFYIKNLQKVPATITLETISDGFDQGPEKAESSKAYLDRFREVGSETLSELIEKLGSSGNPVDCIIYDPFLPWAHFHMGKLQVPLKEDEISLPAMPKLQLGDMPSFFFTYVENPALLDLLVGQFSNIDQADWVFSNAFYELSCRKFKMAGINYREDPKPELIILYL